MKKNISIVLLPLIFIAFFTLNSNAQEATFSKKSYNVGLVKWGKKWSYRIAYKNTGKTELSVIGVSYADGETASPKLIYFNKPGYDVKPGDSGSVEMLIDPKEARDSFKVNVVVSFSGGYKASTVVKGLVKVPAWADRKGAIVFIQNNFCDLDKVNAGEEKKCTFTLQNVGDEILLLSDVKSSGDSLQLTWNKEPIQPGKTTEVVAVFTPEGKGSFRKYITVKTNMRDPKVATLTLIIKGKLPLK